MTVKINGMTVEADGFIWDGCHKIYLIDTPESLLQMLESGWSTDNIRPISELPDAWNSSCYLRFISSGDLTRQYISQCEDGTVSIDNL